MVNDGGVDGREAARCADAAMYTAKSRGGNQFAVCDTVESAAPSCRLRIENALRHAIERRQFTVVYQPLQRFSDSRPGCRRTRRIVTALIGC